MRRHRRYDLKFLASIALPAIVCLYATHASPQRRAPRARTPTPVKPQTDYTNFNHQTHVAAQKLSCNSCHKTPTKNWKDVRKGDAAFPDVAEFPEHNACLSCHRAQFFARERPAPAICSNCHVAVTPRDTARWLFPSLGDVADTPLKRRDTVPEFGVAFPHDKHMDAVGVSSFARTFVFASFGEQRPAPQNNCLVCHQLYRPQANSSDEYVTKPPRDIGDNFWLKKGTFMTSPNSHAACFSCHLEDSGLTPEPKDCGSCHKLAVPTPSKSDFDGNLSLAMGADRIMVEAWRQRISAGAFRHEGGEHPDLSCLSCHNVERATFSTIDRDTTRIAITRCGGAGGCHITATTNDGGALNFEVDSRRKNPNFVCTKCHVTFGKEAIPASHPKAVPTPKAKAS